MTYFFKNVDLGGAFDPARLVRSDGCVIVGSSASGKSTLVRGLRNCQLALDGVIGFPRRFITRSMRLNEDLEENEVLTESRMRLAIARSELEVWWTRQLGDRTEYYAFRKQPRDTFPVYSANNAILRSRDPQILEFLFTKAVIQVYAPDELRRARLRSRSPDMVAERPREASMRLADSSDSIVPLVDFIIRTDGDHGVGAGAAIQELIRNLALCPTPYITNI